MKNLLAALTFLLAPVMAQADLINGGFETGNFTGWKTIGDALVVDSSIGTAPGGGNYQALITNAPSRPITGQHFQSYSGINSVSACPASLSPDPLDAFLGMPRCSLTAFAIPVISTPTKNRASHTARSPNKARGIDHRPAIPLLPNPSISDLAGWRTCLMGEKVTRANAAKIVMKTASRYAATSMSGPPRQCQCQATRFRKIAT